MKIKMQIEVDYDPVLWHDDDDAGRKWFEEEVLCGELILHSNYVGDSIGPVTVLEAIIEPDMEASDLTTNPEEPICHT